MDKSGKCGCDHIKGISCDVKNCVYHVDDCHCSADGISVGPSHASDSTDTACITFKQKRDETAF